MSQTSVSTPEKVHYLVVVHGMGEPRNGSTILPVINRIAESRALEVSPNAKIQTKDNTITLGKILAQVDETQWVEFKGIPAYPRKTCNCEHCGNASEHLFLCESCKCGNNLRFVDLYWGDVTNTLLADAGEPVKSWTQALVSRVDQRMKRAKENLTRSQILSFNVEMQLQVLLENLRKTLIPIQQALSMRFRVLDDLIFNRFLGDVQLYAEFSKTRERASVRFHERMIAVHRQHLVEETMRAEKGLPNRIPVYHVISHSLGTVMSLDALVSGRRKGAEWIDYIENWVTLGSPIDKFLMLWPENYTHLGNQSDPYWEGFNWGTAWTGRKIKHYNFCDEQDPVGHNLDLFHKQPVAKALFERKEDKVYVRYPVPGKAHVDYWTDRELFHHILNITVDELPSDEPSKPAEKRRFRDSMTQIWNAYRGTEQVQQTDKAYKVRWYIPKVYGEVMKISYTLLPLTFWILLASLMLIFTFSSSFGNDNGELVLKNSHVILRVLVMSTFVGGYTFIEWFMALTNKSFLGWIFEKGNFIALSLFLGIFAPITFIGVMFVGIGAMALMAGIMGLLWLYFRIMEIMIQWRQMTVMLSDVTNATTYELKDREGRRWWLRFRIGASATLWVMAFIPFFTAWLDEVINPRWIQATPFPTFRAWRQDFVQVVVDMINPFAYFANFYNPEQVYTAVVVGFVTVLFMGVSIYGYRAIKYYRERAKTVALKRMLPKIMDMATKPLPDAPSANSNPNPSPVNVKATV